MANVLVRDVLASDVEQLIANLRKEDKAEILAYSDDIAGTITHALQHSAWARAAEVDGELACLFGVGPVSMLSESGVPWMLGTDVMNRNKRSVITFGKQYIQAMLNEYPHLWNMVHAENKRSIKWLKRLGFTIHEAQPFGPNNAMFHPFEMRV